MTAGYTVRPPTPADHGRWRELNAAYAAFYQAEQAEQTEQAAATVWSWLSDPHHEVNALLAVTPAGRVVALAHYRTFARPLTASTGCYLDDLYVEPPVRGTGVVDALLAELRLLAQRNGWSVVRWITAHDNDRARGQVRPGRHSHRLDHLRHNLRRPTCSLSSAHCTTARSCSA